MIPTLSNLPARVDLQWIAGADPATRIAFPDGTGGDWAGTWTAAIRQDPRDDAPLLVLTVDDSELVSDDDLHIGCAAADLDGVILAGEREFVGVWGAALDGKEIFAGAVLVRIPSGRVP